jgi:hypothetical protein
MIRDVYPGSGFFPSRIPKPDSGTRSWIQWSKKHWIPNPGTGSATLLFTMCYGRFTRNLCLDLKLIFYTVRNPREVASRIVFKKHCSFSIPPPPSDYSNITSPEASCKSITGRFFKFVPTTLHMMDLGHSFLASHHY